MTCVISSYSTNQFVSFLIVILPIFFIECFAIYTLIKAVNYLRNYPETITRLLISEIRLYPFIIISCFLPKFIKHILKYLDYTDEDIFVIFIIDRFALAILGALLCFVFVWKREGFNISKFFRNSDLFDKPSSSDLRNFSYFN